MTEPLVITHHQNKTLTPTESLAARSGTEEPVSAGPVGKKRRKGRKMGGEGLEDTRETRRIHSGERCLSTVVNPLQGLVSCQAS